jgi:hypothetical protein
LKYAKQPLKLTDIFGAVKLDLRKEGQRPSIQNDAVGVFYFSKPNPKPVVTPTPPPKPQVIERIVYRDRPTLQSQNDMISSSTEVSGDNQYNNSVGIQIGAFSNAYEARKTLSLKLKNMKNKSGVVKVTTIRGMKIYKAIIIGFKSRAEAKSTLYSGSIDGFVVSNIHP